MAESTVPLALPPGLANNGTVYQTKGRWHDGNLVRFFQGTIRPIGGWSQRSLTGATITGAPMDAVAWTRLDGTPIMVIGTTTSLFAVDSSNVVTDLFAAGTNPFLGATPGAWQLSVFGGYLTATYQTASDPVNPSYSWDGNIAHVPAPAVVASPPYSLPLGGIDIFTTPEYFQVILGACDANTVLTPTLVPDARLVWWASQARGTAYDLGAASDAWTPLVTNSAGSFELQTKGALVCGAAARGLSLVWTTTDLWSMTYIGGDLDYRFDKIGDGCGIIARRAKVVLDNMTLWMGNNRFYSYNGFAQPLPCDVQDYIFTPGSATGLNPTYAHLTWAFANTAFSEVTWFYVAGGSNSAINAYVTYNYVENHWTYGWLPRVCGVPFQSPGVVPVLIDANGNIFDHETANVRTGGPALFLESGPIELGLGDVVYSVQHVIPDDKTLGDVQLKFYTSLYPDASETLSSAYTLANPTSVRLTARQMRVRIEEVNAVSWRIGNMRLKVTPSGAR